MLCMRRRTKNWTPRCLEGAGRSGAKWRVARRLVREARVLASLEHPGIVPVHDVGTLQDGRVFYTMKFVEGQASGRIHSIGVLGAGSSPPISAHLHVQGLLIFFAWMHFPLDIRERLTYSSFIMNTLPIDKQRVAIQALIEGNSIRSTERMTGIHRDTIMRLLVRVGEACARFLDSRIKQVQSKAVQVDEIWTYVFKKQARIIGNENLAGIGDQYVFVGIDADTKLVISHLVGRRDGASAYHFMRDLRDRLATRVQLTTDGFKPYIGAVDDTFGTEVDYAQLVKIYGQPQASASSKLLRTCPRNRCSSDGGHGKAKGNGGLYVLR